MDESITVNVDNFARAETDRMFARLGSQTRGINAWAHFRAPSPIDSQTVIRENRDTLYSAAIVDISAGATLEIPDAGDRYLSVMVVNQDHYIDRVFHGAGTYSLDVGEFGTPYVLLAVRLLVDPSDPADVQAVHALQDRFAVTANSARPFVMPDYEAEGFTATRNALLELARGVDDFDRAFGSKGDVDPIRHLIGTAAGWGGLPTTEALYINVDTGLPVGDYALTVGDVPVDAFWSISLYNAEGYFEQNPSEQYNVNSVTAARNDDGTVTVNFGADATGKPNFLPIMDGWNYIVRLYRPRPEVLDGTWTFPTVQPA
jgi:hypothetical protein